MAGFAVVVVPALLAAAIVAGCFPGVVMSGTAAAAATSELRRLLFRRFFSDHGHNFLGAPQCGVATENLGRPSETFDEKALACGSNDLCGTWVGHLCSVLTSCRLRSRQRKFPRGVVQTLNLDLSHTPEN